MGGSWRAVAPTACENSSRIGSSVCKWKAWEILSSVPATPRKASALALLNGRFRAGDDADTGPVHRREREFASKYGSGLGFREAEREHLPSGRSCMSLPRRATSLSASPSEKTPRGRPPRIRRGCARSCAKAGCPTPSIAGAGRIPRRTAPAGARAVWVRCLALPARDKAARRSSPSGKKQFGAAIDLFPEDRFCR